MDQLDKIDKEGKEKENKNWHTIRSENKTNFELNFLVKTSYKEHKKLDTFIFIFIKYLPS